MQLAQRRVILTGQQPVPANLTPYLYCYDEAGKMRWSPNRAYSYFARGKVASVTSGAGVVSQYLYDGDGVRVSKSEPSGSTQIILDPTYREITGTAATNFEAMFVAGGNVARRVLQQAVAGSLLQTSDLAWFSNDHLGGTYFLTGSQGQEVAGTRAFYRPYGKFVDAGAAPQTDKSGNRQFASKELDATGLYDFAARLYDPDTGRFTQADEVQSRGGSQALNRSTR